ncbi:DUF5054 domain-containing protein [Cohnella soli]|uniref:DUF5054 domain-containing protein n=1 Tax=Cohnella soli TaxID=425005 RepID=A0ABW0HU77_9BACL
MTNIKRLHVIFKTHLDIGFTDFARQVEETYMNDFIPQALSLSERMAETSGKSRFVWTVGSWLISQYLQSATEEQRARMEQAIARGDIAWHGIPFTTHTELMDAKLFEFGLSLSRRLDHKYGKQTIAAKMTDVPGHTIGMVPYLARNGIRYLHLGVNPACTPPSVPKVFVWRASDGSEIVVNYAEDYGQALRVEGLEDALYFAHTGDNLGPPSLEEIERMYERLREEYPEAEVAASTLDAFAEKLLVHKSSLPVLSEEIGDSWIHGVATDPAKVARYRELLRLRDKWLEAGALDADSEAYAQFCSRLMLIPEHTWGLDEKVHLADFTNYSAAEFTTARAEDEVADHPVKNKYEELYSFYRKGSYRKLESSWEEQRSYIDQALSALTPELQEEARQAFGRLLPDLTSGNAAGEELETYREYELGKFRVSFYSDGAIGSLMDGNVKMWTGDNARLGVFRYETFGQADYDRFFREYAVHLERHYTWAEPDLGKPGIEYAKPVPEHRRYSPTVRSLRLERQADGDKVLARLEMPPDVCRLYGAPRQLMIVYLFHSDEPAIDVELHWQDKQACRLPEASWFSFVPAVDNPNRWTMDKLGELVSPLSVVKNGNRNMHAVGNGLYYDGADGTLIIETLDAPIVCPGEPRLLQFDNTFAPLEGGFHFNLHNNVWGTNFRMWFEEDMKFRFRLTFGSNL